jgi:hypothetical protein
MPNDAVDSLCADQRAIATICHTEKTLHLRAPGGDQRSE